MSVTIEGTNLTCPRHPKYKAKRQPKISFFLDKGYCATCWDLWEMALDSKNLQGDLQDLRKNISDYAERNQ